MMVFHRCFDYDLANTRIKAPRGPGTGREGRRLAREGTLNVRPVCGRWRPEACRSTDDISDRLTVYGHGIV